MLTVVLFFCLISGLGSAPAAPPTPKPCCFGHQFTATLHEVIGSYSNGVPSTFEIDMKLYYDFDNMMLKREREDGVVIVQDFKKRKEYTVTKASCQSVDMTSFTHLQPPCLPDNATLRGQYYIGDDVNYDVNVWYIENTRFGNVTVSTMAEDCTPIIQGISSNLNNVISQTTVFFNDIVFANHTAATFQLPASCP